MSKPDKKPPIKKPAKLFYCRWSRSSHRRSRRAPPLMKPRLRRWLSAFYRTGCCSPSACARQATTSTSLWQGERRLRACRLAKLERIPAIIQDFDDSETAALGLLENLQRAQLDAFDAARGIREVIRLWNCTQAEAARRLGLSQPALANKLRLLTPDHRPAAALHRCRSDRAPRPRCTAPAGKPPHHRAGKKSHRTS